MPSNASATIVEGTVNSSKELNDFITHHVKDAHSWHIWGENKTQVNADGTVDVLSSTAIHIGLPILLIDNGLVTANSDDFNELRWIEQDGDTTYYAQGKINETEYVMFHEKIYHLGSGLKLDEKGHPTNSRPLDLPSHLFSAKNKRIFEQCDFTMLFSHRAAEFLPLGRFDGFPKIHDINVI